MTAVSTTERQQCRPFCSLPMRFLPTDICSACFSVTMCTFLDISSTSAEMMVVGGEGEQVKQKGGATKIH